LSQVSAIGQIDFQDGNRRAPDRGLAFKKWAVTQKVLSPPVAAWIEKRDNAFGKRITSRDVRPFVVVARKAR
jgi:predicted GTPase